MNEIHHSSPFVLPSESPALLFAAICGLHIICSVVYLWLDSEASYKETLTVCTKIVLQLKQCICYRSKLNNFLLKYFTYINSQFTLSLSLCPNWQKATKCLFTCMVEYFRVCTLFQTKHSRTFQRHIPHFSRTSFRYKKSLESTSFLVLPQLEQFFWMFFCVCSYEALENLGWIKLAPTAPTCTFKVLEFLNFVF